MNHDAAARPNPEPTAAQASEPRPRRAAWRRLLEIGVLLFCPLFLHSCSLSTIKLSMGPAAPIFVMEVDGDDFWPVQIEHFSSIAALMNLALALGFVYLLAIPRVRDWFLSSSVRYTLWVFVFVSNSMMLCRFIPHLAYVWFWGVMQPIGFMIQFVRPAVEWSARQLTTPDSAAYDTDVIATAITARLYYLIVLIVGPSIPKLTRWFHRYVLQASPDRWWQLSLRGWFALTLIIGLLISVITYFVQQSG